MTYRELRDFANDMPECMLDWDVIGFKKGHLMPNVPFDIVNLVELKDEFGRYYPVLRLTENK